METIKGDKVKYVSIELVLHPSKLESGTASMDDVIEFGLFKGVRKLVETNANQEFILVVPPKDKSAVILTNDKHVKAFAMDSYNVLSLEVFDGTTRHICFSKADDDDQAEATKIIAMIMDALRLANKMTRDSDIIDVTLYKELPEMFNDPMKKSVNTLNTGGTNHVSSVGTTHQNWASHNAVNTVDYTRKPFFFRRKTALPHHATLKKMAAHLDKILDSDYIPPEWPVIVKEVEEMSRTANLAAQSEHEDEINAWQGCG